MAKEFSPNQKKSRSCIYPALFILAVKSIESKAESFGGADWEGENPEQQRFLLQTAGGAGQAKTSHIQGLHLSKCPHNVTLTLSEGVHSYVFKNDNSFCL